MRQRYSYLSVLALSLTTVFLQAGDLQSPLSPLGDSELDTFVLGRSFFRTPWVEAPSATTARDGLGPLFSANTCISCHPKNGKGRVYSDSGNISRSLVTRLSIDNNKSRDEKIGFAPEPTYGSQLSINGVYGVPYEGKPTREYSYKVVRAGKDRNATLRKPIYGVKDLRYGEMSKDTILSQRVAPALVGLGLLEQISDREILKNEDIDDRDGDGISGKANRVYTPRKSSSKSSNIHSTNHKEEPISHPTREIGRFNWKASASKVKQQVAGAMSNDMGLTSPLYPNENCTHSQKECLSSPKGRDRYDVPMRRLDAVSFYLKHLKVPKTDQDQDYRDGLSLFKQIECVSCHISTFKLESGETIHPFSDLLLHDMGDGLADGRVEFQATGSEFRTPPLWGISIYSDILGGSVNFLHDGRARGVEEAILWHSGEAERSKVNYRELSSDKQKILIDFLERL